MITLQIVRSKNSDDWIHVEKIYDLIQWSDFIPISQPHNYNNVDGWPRDMVAQWVKYNVLSWSVYNPEIIVPTDKLSDFVAQVVLIGAKCTLVDEVVGGTKIKANLTVIG